MLIAVDPGGATGIAMLSQSGEFHTETVEGGFDAMSDWIDHGDWDGFVDAVVIENFVPRGGALSIQLDALWIIGAIKHVCRMYSIPLILQTPTQAKSFASNDHLKAVGYYAVGADHERDAARHLLVFLASSPRVLQGPYSIERTRILNALAAM